jgi:putative oxidoreductase
VEILKDLALLFGRVCVGSVFIWAAFEKLLHWHGTVDYAKRKNLPYVSLLLPAAVALQILGGLSLFLGYYARLGSLALILFIIPAAFRFHDFWNVQGEERVAEKIYFMKDIAILGGLILLLITGAGRFSMTA